MPETIGGYTILSEIGSGGFGTVYRAYDPRSGRAVALKTLNYSGADSDTVERFRREGRVLANIDHPHVIHLLKNVGMDVWNDNIVLYIVMELMPLSLMDALASGNLSLCRSMKICFQAARGLKAVHGSGVTHRDVKPQNILIDWGGHVRIADFGIARAENLSNLTTTGVAIGTGRYMSPEQRMDSKRVDTRSDIYSLGVTLHEMLTGNEYEFGHSVKSVRASIPDALESVVKKCVEMDPSRRYQTMDELIRAISQPALINRCALIDFYEATGGPGWKRNDNWLSNKPLGEWYGITTNRDGVVTGFDIRMNNLKGRIPSEIGHLTELESLQVIMTGVSGSIPPELGSLTKLERLVLVATRLFGSVPSELGNLTELKSLALGYNRLSGSIPPELSNLTKLESLYLSGNNWTGCIPKALFNARKNDLDKIDLPICDDS